MKKITFDKVLFFVSPNDFTVPPGLVEQGVQADDIVEKARENDENFRRNFKIQFELTRYSYLIQATKLSIEQLSIKLSPKHAIFLDLGFGSSEPLNPKEFVVNRPSQSPE